VHDANVQVDGILGLEVVLQFKFEEYITMLNISNEAKLTDHPF
jgi:hypothetical protein